MNIFESDSGMVPLMPKKEQAAAPQQQPSIPGKGLVYSASVEDPEKKPMDNNTNNSNSMDSTPLSDIMSGNDMAMADQMPMGGMMQQQQQMMQMQQQQLAPPPQQQQQYQKKQGGSNLTDEQIQALLAGLCAMIAFSGPVQERMAGAVPQFVTQSGDRTTVGLVATGLVAAILFYFGKRFV